MKLSAYKDLEASKRAQTLSRIVLIAGAHAVIIGGAYLVTHFGGSSGGEAGSVAGVGTWSNQGPNASQPSVDASSGSLFDSRAADLSGYNAGEGKPMTVAANNPPVKPSGARYTPRRPSESRDSASAPNNGSRSSAAIEEDDDILQPLNNTNNPLYPARSPARPADGLSQTFEYKVQNGDSLWGISKRFNVAVSDITAANPGIKANAIMVGQTINVPRSSGAPAVSPSPQPTQAQPPAANGLTYTVKSGDSLSRIASRQGVTVAELKAANGLSGDMIRIGQELVIPSKTRSADLVSKQHRGPKVTVEAGDTLEKYAAIYSVPVREIMRLNKIDDPRMIRIGETILIPENSQAAPAMQQTRPQRQPQPNRQPAEQELRTLDQLAPEDEALPTLPTLDDEFAEDIENQPLVPINE